MNVFKLATYLLVEQMQLLNSNSYMNASSLLKSNSIFPLMYEFLTSDNITIYGFEGIFII